MSIFIPKKKQKEYVPNDNYISFSPFNRFSRIPFGGDVIKPYSVHPSIRSIEKSLKKHLKDALSGKYYSVDSGNADFLDKLIDDWKKTAISELKKQHIINQKHIKMLANNRVATIENAKDILLYEKDSIQRLENEIKHFKNEYEKKW